MTFVSRAAVLAAACNRPSDVALTLQAASCCYYLFTASTLPRFPGGPLEGLTIVDSRCCRPVEPLSTVSRSQLASGSTVHALGALFGPLALPWAACSGAECHSPKCRSRRRRRCPASDTNQCVEPGRAACGPAGPFSHQYSFGRCNDGQSGWPFTRVECAGRHRPPARLAPAARSAASCLEPHCTDS